MSVIPTALQVTDTLRHISGERGLLRYLGALQHTAASPHFRVGCNAIQHVHRNLPVDNPISCWLMHVILPSLTGAAAPAQAIRPVTRLMLESELYQLTAVGGPRYLPRSVNSAAFLALVGACSCQNGLA